MTTHIFTVGTVCVHLTGVETPLPSIGVAKA
jgi:hypothetical protein